MGDVLVKAGAIADGRITSLVVGLARLPDRTIDRETAIRWMRDGHSFVPVHAGTRLRALQLVEAGDGHVIRDDHEATDRDTLPHALLTPGR